MTDEEIEEYFNRVRTQLENVKTRSDLVDFVDLLEEGAEKKFFEEADMRLADFLMGMGVFLESLDGFAKNRGLEVPEQPSWKWVGQFLLGAIAHA